ncbi:MAG TPA: DUF58 domain-containing protein [Bacteroidota bacterium]|jgi:uncharacterized protein (DUF58 family)|nr:DUF58 domain-containing protein [Bacteroidota bacterium]
MQFWRSFYLQKRFYRLIALICALFLAAHFFPLVIAPARIAAFLLAALTVFDVVLLYRRGNSLEANRRLAVKLSNGDENAITIELTSGFNFPLSGTVIDELPFVFQRRDFRIPFTLPAGARKTLSYSLRPLQRGEFEFGAMNVFCSTPVSLAVRRFRFEENARCAVYPSIKQMKRYELYAISDRLTEAGVKKIRPLGHTLEFDQIRDYVQGDDHRTLNWKATARRQKIMVNQYQDEKAQQVFCVIDMGRSMKMPFNGLTLLDYAINASLVMSNIIIHKQDKAGLITFSDDVHTILPARARYAQMFHILEALYAQRTSFQESDFERMCAAVARRIKQRSLLLLFTNFESMVSLRRRIAALKRLNHRHVLVVIFFENSELDAVVRQPAEDAEDVYRKMVSQKLMYEKRLIVRELGREGIYSMLVAPENVTVASINKYLELKARGTV